MVRDLSKADLKTVNVRLYEGLFLVDPVQAAADWDSVMAAVRGLLEKAKAEIVSIGKWDDRKLAYKIRKETRGAYIICYFRVNSTSIQQMERNIQLSATIWRALILNAERMSPKDIERETPAMAAERMQQRPAEEAADRAAEPKEQAAKPEPADSIESVVEDTATE